VEERIKIINDFKSSIGKSNYGIDKRIKRLTYFYTYYLILNTIAWGLILFSIVRDFLKIDIKHYRWNKSALMVFLGTVFLLKIIRPTYEIKLLKHLKKLKSNSNIEIEKELNSGFKKIITPFGKKIIGKFIIGLSLIILLLGIWQMGFSLQRPIWEYIKIPVLIYFIIVMFELYRTNKKLGLNIQKVEERL